MKKSVAALQVLGTLAILALVPGNFLKVGLLLLLWALTFRRFSKKEWIAFFGINLIFIVSDIGAIKNGFFLFNAPDFLGLPAWEFVMWGFYLLHLARLFPPKILPRFDLKVLVLAVLFSLLFGVVQDRNVLLALTSGVLILTLALYRDKEDLVYCVYMMMLGIAFEFVGIRFGLWAYPERDFATALVQFEVMWGASGIFFRRILITWLNSEKNLLAENSK